jgi:peptidoglycan/LPS O-acetylase OafA/YrhL
MIAKPAALPRLGSIEMLRAGCALMVLFSHLYGETLGLHQNTLLVTVTSFSLEAVAGFFVLSGCVISLQNYVGTAQYVRARLVRILPIYYVMLIFSVVAMGLCSTLPELGRTVGNALFVQTLFWDPLFPVRFYVSSWSLAYEIYYYAAFIVLMAMPRLVLPAFVVSIAVGLSLYTYVWSSSDGLSAVLHPIAYFAFWLAGVGVTRLCRAGRTVSLATAAYMFMIGVCIGRVPFAEPAKYDFLRLLGFSLGFAFVVWAFVGDALVEPARRKVLDLGLPWRCVLSVLALGLLWTVSTAHLDMRTVITAGVAAFTVSPGAMARAVSFAFRPLRSFLIYVGGLSYALYLVHYPLVQTFNALAILPPAVNVAVVAVLSFALAHLLDYKFQPWIRARIPGKRRPPKPLASSA